jgi:hypothetical protein
LRRTHPDRHHNGRTDDQCTATREPLPDLIDIEEFFDDPEGSTPSSRPARTPASPT